MKKENLTQLIIILTAATLCLVAFLAYCAVNHFKSKKSQELLSEPEDTSRENDTKMQIATKKIPRSCQEVMHYDVHMNEDGKYQSVTTSHEKPADETGTKLHAITYNAPKQDQGCIAGK